MNGKILLCIFSLACILFFGCSSQDNPQSVPLTMVHLQDGTPTEARAYFEQKLGEEDGGLHVFHQGEHTYLLLAEPNRMISTVQEYPDHVRVETIYSPSTLVGGTYSGGKDIPGVLYITKIPKIQKTYGVFAQES